METPDSFYSSISEESNSACLHDDIEKRRNYLRKRLEKIKRGKDRRSKIYKEDPIILNNLKKLRSMYPIWYPWYNKLYTDAKIYKNMSLKSTLTEEFKKLALERIDYLEENKNTLHYTINDISENTQISPVQLRYLFNRNVFNTDKTFFSTFEYYLYSDALMYAYDYKEVLNIAVKKKVFSYISLFIKSNYEKYKKYFREDNIFQYVRQRIFKS